MMLTQLDFLLITLTVSIVYWMNGQRQRRNLPPGPKNYPLIGSVLSMPSTLEWETYAKWGKEYNSDIIHVNALGTSILILNSYKVASDLLDQRSSNYSSRPHMIMFHELSGWGFIFGVLPYGSVWRASRRMFSKFFNPSNPSYIQPREITYVRRFLGQLLQKPDDFLQHVRTLVGSTTLSMTYNINVRPYNDPYIKIVEEAARSIAELLIPGAFLVDIIPILKYVPKWFPGAKFQSKAAIMRKEAAKMRNTMFAATEGLMASSDCDPSFVSEAIREVQYSDAPNLPGKDINLVKDVAVMMYLAGADTTTSAIGTFFLAMSAIPRCRRRLKQNLTVSSMVNFRNIVISLPFPISRRSLKKFSDGRLYCR